MLTWGYNFQGGFVALQSTNFAVVTSNNFTATFGYQFLILLIILLLFLLVLACTNKLIHSPTVMLLKRKKIIFPIRLVTLFFNVLLLSSLMQVTSINGVVSFRPESFSLSVLALVTIFLILVGIAVISNWRKF